MQNDLRRLIMLCEQMMETRTPRHGADGIVPDTLYHGTSLQNYLDIRATNVFQADANEQGNHGFSTTEDENVAIRFARMTTSTDQWGVVLTLDGHALAKLYRVEAYDDDDEHGTLGDHYEYEWTILSDNGKIEGASRFITMVQVIDAKGDPNHLLPWDEAVHGVDPDAAPDHSKLRRSYPPLKAKAALLALAIKHHVDQEPQKLRGLIARLDQDGLYRMLGLYLQRKPA